MRHFVSTRGGPPVSFAEALFRGLAPDGGLYMPVGDLHLDEAALPDGSSLADTACWVTSTLSGDGVTSALLAEVSAAALDFPIPMVEIEPGVHVLELFHGPTLAFKDVGARFMARLMHALEPGRRHRTVLVATSGDTGSAVARAFHGMDGYRVLVLFPAGGISSRQRRQMTTLGGNVTAVAVDGTFDDCQRMAKEAFADARLAEHAGLTSANSINVGRLLPQSVYYVHAALALGWRDTAPTFVVPSGNLGNLTGGLLARRAGMPVAGFVAASNVNRVFPDYLYSGVLRPRPSVPTASNAMDVGAPSNLERIRWMYDDDLAHLREDVRGAWCDDDETRRWIADVYERTGYVLDPHAAVGYGSLRKTPPDAGPSVLLATAHPAKFPEIVEEATGRTVPAPDTLASTLEAEERIVKIKPDIRVLRRMLIED
jgi:threonine synthase